LATLLPWVQAGIGEDPRAYTGIDLLALAVPVVAVAAGVLVATLVEGALRGRDRMSAALTLSLGAAAATGLLIAMLELASALIPDDFLPATVRRLAVDLSAGIGLWVAFIVFLVAAVAAAGERGPVRVGANIRGLGRRPGRAAAALALLVAAIALFGWVRYEPWVDASAAGQHVSLAGSTTPWVAPLSLLALWLLIAGLAAALLRQGQLGALVAAAAGWLVTFLAALTIITAETFGRLRTDDLAIGHLRGVDPSFGAAPAAWTAFGTGVAAAAAGAILVSACAGKREEPAWTQS
jgi:hypothetical protein